MHRYVKQIEFKSMPEHLMLSLWVVFDDNDNYFIGKAYIPYYQG